MYRLSGAVRRAERCIHWRSLLGDAASTQAQQAAPAAFAEASRQGAASLVRSVATRCSRAHSTHAAGAEQSAVVCACVLERLPIVLPPQPAWELEYQARDCWRRSHAVALTAFARCGRECPRRTTEPAWDVRAGVALREDARNLQDVPEGMRRAEAPAQRSS
jgi:hypothetical protein